MNLQAIRSTRICAPWAVALALLFAFAPRAAPIESEHRVALVIGNADYKAAPLLNAVNDARSMSAKLRTLGFEVIERENLTHRAAGEALREFRQRLTPGSVALFFYAGHGVQVNGINYLPLTDAAIVGEEDVPLHSLSVNQVLELMDQAKTRLNVVFLDACLDYPFERGFRGAARGLARIDAPSGTIIAFATRPGNVASDGKRRNGLYTEHLLANIDAPNLAVEQMLKRVVREVKAESKGRQEPWMEGSIEGDFYFNRAEARSPVELKYWDSIRDSRAVRDYEAYLAQFPDGAFAGLARSRIAALAATTTPPDPAVAQRPPPPSKDSEAASAAGTPASQAKRVEEPATDRLPAVGSSWTYRIGSGSVFRTFSVTLKQVNSERIEEVLQTLDGERFETARRSSRSGSIGEGLRETLLPGRYVLTELAPYLASAELEPGRQWTLQDIRLTGARGSSTWPVKLKVSGQETIAIAAGKFTAVRIDGETPVRPVAPGKYAGFAFRFWYVPELGRIARAVRTTVGGFGIAPEETCELVSYHPG
jgi:hypothetical protein